MIDRNLTAAAGFGAGIVNGLLGTGGGILLLLVLRRHADTRDAFASALLCILPLSALSVILHLRDGSLSLELLLSDALPYLLGAVPGGLIGACLLDRISLSALQYLFAALLLFSGWRMAFA
jgi:uncharacterized membrane protein YfcA